MSDTGSTAEPPDPLTWTTNAVVRTWRDFLSVYYANSVPWRLLKSGALVALGFFSWVGANLVLSYRADWGFLYYVMSYGFVLLVWGPFTHLVVVPAIIRIRRAGRGGLWRTFARHGSKLNISVFLLIVLVLGAAPLGIMTFEFQAPADGGGSISPDLQCTRSGDQIHCHLTDSRGIDSMVVTSGGETLIVDDEPPYDFDVNRNDLATENGDRQFTVELRDTDGNVLRRFIRRAELIPG